MLYIEENTTQEYLKETNNMSKSMTVKFENPEDLGLILSALSMAIILLYKANKDMNLPQIVGMINNYQKLGEIMDEKYPGSRFPNPELRDIFNSI